MFLAAFTARSEAQPTFTTVALTGVENEYGPQLGSGISFSSLSAFDFNSSNHFVFSGALSAPDTFPAVAGIWSSDQVANQPIALLRRAGVADPELFSRFERVLLDQTGLIVFEGSKEPTGGGSFDIWVHEQSQNTPIVERGDLGLSGIGRARVSNGRVVFSATTGGLSNIDLWSNTAAGIAPIALHNTDGPLGPNLGPGVRFVALDEFDYQVTKSGEAVFFSRVSGSGADGVWRTSPNGPQPLALEGVSNHLGPGLGDNVVFTEIWPNLGVEKGVNEVAFSATFLRENLSERGVFKVGTNGNTLLALANADGSLGPQLGPGITFAIPRVNSINSRGDVLISSNLSGVAQTGAWINSGSGNVPVALTNTDSEFGPQLGGGIQFAGIFLDDQYVDDIGQVLFRGLLKGPSVSAADDMGAWAWSNGVLFPLLREGEILDVDTGFGVQQRRVQSFSLGQFTPPNRGTNFAGFDRPSSSQGLIALRIDFDDGSSGIFVTQVPEPSTVAIIACGVIAVALWRGLQRAG